MSHVVLLMSHPFLEWRNGADLATLQLARQLQARGHTCTIELVLMDVEPALAAWRAKLGAPPGDELAIHGIPTRVRRLPSSDLAARCWRRVDAALAAMFSEVRPDVVVVPWGTLPLAQAARAHHDRVLLLVQNPEAVDALTPEATRGLTLATVSADLSQRIHQRAGRAPLVILNAIERDGVVATDGPRDRVGMVSCCAEKGAVVFLNAAANLREVRFVATGGDTAITTALPNVEITPTLDRMAEFYAGVRVLLVPSLMPEAFGRVVIEAQLSGIPVVCTSRCGARDWAGFVIPVPRRPADTTDERWLHDAELHRATITGFLDALVSLEDPASYAVASEQALDAAARYGRAQLASVERFERWVGG